MYDLLFTIHYEHLFPKIAVNIYYSKKCKNRRMRSNNSDFHPNYSAISMSWCIFGTLWFVHYCKKNLTKICKNKTEKIFSVRDHVWEEKGPHRRFYIILGYSKILWDTLGYSRIFCDTLRYSEILWENSLILFSFSFFDFLSPILFPSLILTKSGEEGEGEWKGTNKVLWPRGQKLKKYFIVKIYFFQSNSTHVNWWI